MPSAPRIALRLADREPPKLVGSLTAKLSATQRHDRACAWFYLDELIDDQNRLPDEIARRWGWGRGPLGLRIGLTFIENDLPFLPHPAPGELAVTAGLGVGDLCPWIEGMTEALRRGRARFEVQADRFSLARSLHGGWILTAQDWDGRVEARTLLADDVATELSDQLRALPELERAAEQLGAPTGPWARVRSTWHQLREVLDAVR